MEWVKILEPGSCFGPRFHHSHVPTSYSPTSTNLGATPPVDLLPFLKYIPERFAPWKAKMRQVSESFIEYDRIIAERL